MTRRFSGFLALQIVSLATAALALAGCADAAGDGSVAEGAALSVDYEKYELDNGLDVVLHVDRSDPVAAVAMTFHVGSAREVPGRTGFAHMFEHLFFLDSENLGPGGLDRLMNRVGSSANGSTSRDRTNYFEVVPSDALEKALWAEADKLGFFINTVSESVVDKERQVVKNEKRQRVDNRPYGHTNFVLDEALYPEGHPYRWQVIGSLADLDAAILEDVKDFHRRWYGANNATLVVAGDIDVEQTKAWVEKYFGEIAAGPQNPPFEAPDVALDGEKRLFHEDNFANLPELTLAWPTVEQYHPDSYALDVLAELLTGSRKSPLYKVVVEGEGLEGQGVAPDVSAFSGNSEQAGRFAMRVRSFQGTDLDEVHEAVRRGFARFEALGVDAADLRRVKARSETAFYNGLSSTLGKAFQLAQYNIFADSPGYLTEDLERTLAVTAVDVQRVYETYLKDRPFVATSFVPRGGVDLALEGSDRASVVEEPIVPGAGEVGAVTRGEARTPSSFDRSEEPPFGPTPSLTAPEVWRTTLANGLPVLGIVDRELPTVQFTLRIKGGLLADDPEQVGAANLLAEIMTEGTARRTSEELEQAIEELGASITVTAGRQSFRLSGSTLARNFDETISLLEEILLEPRWDEDELELARRRTLNRIRQAEAQPTAIAANAFNRLLYGDHILGESALGSAEIVEALSMDDLRAYYARALSPSVAALHVAGAVEQAAVAQAFAGIGERWAAVDVALPAEPAQTAAPGVYFVDVPGSSQSVVNIGYLGPPETDPEYYAATVMNFRFGGGGFASDLTQVLREQRGYTYGIGSGFGGTDLPGPFGVFSSIRSNATHEALELVRDMMESYGPTFDGEDLEATKSFLLRSNAMAFETLGDKLGILEDMSLYGFEADYVLDREDIVREIDAARIRALADRYVDPERMMWLVVGDRATQMDRLAGLDLGAPTLLDRDGRRADEEGAGP
ncbi:MAG: pitrilysin family protein [Gemmatimonadota bacterium]